MCQAPEQRRGCSSTVWEKQNTICSHQRPVGKRAIRGLTAQEPMQILYAAVRAGRASANEQVVLPRVRALRSTRSAWLACSARTHLPEPSCNDTLLPATEEACWAAKVGKHKVKVVKPDGGFVHERNDP